MLDLENQREYMGVFKPIIFTSTTFNENESGLQLASFIGDHLIKNGFVIITTGYSKKYNNYYLVVENGSKKNGIDLIFDQETKSWMLILGCCNTLYGSIFGKETGYTMFSRKIFACCENLFNENKSVRRLESG